MTFEPPIVTHSVRTEDAVVLHAIDGPSDFAAFVTSKDLRVLTLYVVADDIFRAARGVVRTNGEDKTKLEILTALISFVETFKSPTDAAEAMSCIADFAAAALVDKMNKKAAR